MFYCLHILLQYFFQPDQKLFQMVLLCNAGQVFNVIIECTGAGGNRPIYLVRRLGTGQAAWCSIAWLIWHGKALHAMIRYGFIWRGMVWQGKAWAGAGIQLKDNYLPIIRCPLCTYIGYRGIYHIIS